MNILKNFNRKTEIMNVWRKKLLGSLNTSRYEVGQATIKGRLNNGKMWFRSFLKYYFRYHINVDYMSWTFSSHK